MSQSRWKWILPNTILSAGYSFQHSFTLCYVADEYEKSWVAYEWCHLEGKECASICTMMMVDDGVNLRWCSMCEATSAEKDGWVGYVYIYIFFLNSFTGGCFSNRCFSASRCWGDAQWPSAYSHPNPVFSPIVYVCVCQLAKCSMEAGWRGQRIPMEPSPVPDPVWVAACIQTHPPLSNTHTHKDKRPFFPLVLWFILGFIKAYSLSLLFFSGFVHLWISCLWELPVCHSLRPFQREHRRGAVEDS